MCTTRNRGILDTKVGNDRPSVAGLRLFKGLTRQQDDTAVCVLFPSSQAKQQRDEATRHRFRTIASGHGPGRNRLPA